MRRRGLDSSRYANVAPLTGPINPMNESSNRANVERVAGRDGQSRPLVRMILLAPAVFLCSAAAALVAGSQRDSDSPLPVAATAPFPGQFDGRAFSEAATIEDLLNVAEQAAAEIVDAYPDSPTALSVAARKAYLLSDTERSAEFWRKSLELDPKFADGFFGLGLIMMDRDQYEKAAQYFEEVAWRAPDDPRAPVYTADALLHAGRVDEAIGILEEVASTPGASAEALTLLGQAHLQAQQYEQARQSFDFVVQSFPDTAKAVYGLGQAYTRLGDQERAKIYMQRFQTLDRQSREANAERAKSFVDKGYATRVAAQSHHDAARAYRTLGDLTKAEQMWRKAALLEPGSTQHLDQLFALFESQGRHAECFQVAERLADLDPSNADHWLNLGVLNAHLARPNAALTALRKAVSLDPDNPRCRRVIEQLDDL